MADSESVTPGRAIHVGELGANPRAVFRTDPLAMAAPLLLAAGHKAIEEAT